MADSGTPVLASREELAATLAPVTGAEAELMDQATRRAEEHAVQLIERVTRTGRRAAARRLIAVAGSRRWRKRSPPAAAAITSPRATARPG
jgi:hypothetical protein